MMLHLVMGNVSADMDSVCCSIAFAESLKNGIAIINIPKAELALRQDVLFIAGMENVFFKEDLSGFFNLAKKGKALLTLVDHNALDPFQEDWSPFVERIIDHHFDEEISYPQLKEKEIAETGSCATLVSERISLNEKNARLLLAAIILDTHNLLDVEKTKERDVAAVRRLEKYCSPPDFKTLFKKKQDVTGFSEEDLLNKDFKIYKAAQFYYGISSLPKGAEARCLQGFAAKKKIQGFFVSQWRNNQKELLIWPQRICDLLFTDPEFKQLFIPDAFLKKTYLLKEPFPRKTLQPILQKSLIKVL